MSLRSELRQSLKGDDAVCTKPHAQKRIPNAFANAHASPRGIVLPREVIAELRQLALKYAAGVRTALAATTPHDPSPRLPSQRGTTPSRT